MTNARAQNKRRGGKTRRDQNTPALLNLPKPSSDNKSIIDVDEDQSEMNGGLWSRDHSCPPVLSTPNAVRNSLLKSRQNEFGAFDFYQEDSYVEGYIPSNNKLTASKAGLQLSNTRSRPTTPNFKDKNTPEVSQLVPFINSKMDPKLKRSNKTWNGKNLVYFQISNLLLFVY